ncbi:hypothetical protein [Fibrella arboris]|uniref:hypothetical protein n=1 Tax=Fibrella arboris TaxID=3242486 RepID=UPI00352042DD
MSKKKSSADLDLSHQQLAQLTDLLLLLHERYGSDNRFADMVQKLDELGPEWTATGIKWKNVKSLRRELEALFTYLTEHNITLVTPLGAKTYPTQAQIAERVLKRQIIAQEGGKPESFAFQNRKSLKDFLNALIRQFVKHDVQGNPVVKEGRYELKPKDETTLNETRRYTAYFWHLIDHDEDTKDLTGRVVQGHLVILGDWQKATFSYVQPSHKPGPERWRYYQSKVQKNDKYNEKITNLPTNYYLYFTETNAKGDPHDHPSRLMVVLAVDPAHDDRNVLYGTFAGADPKYGHPIHGRAFLIGDTYLRSGSEATKGANALKQQRADLENFAHTQVAYQTRTTLGIGSSFADPTKIHGLAAWKRHSHLFRKPLHGYFFQSVIDQERNIIKRNLVHFILTVDLSQPTGAKAPAIITYDNTALKAEKTTARQVEINEAVVVDALGQAGGTVSLEDDWPPANDSLLTSDEEADVAADEGPVEQGYVAIESYTNPDFIAYRGLFNFSSDTQRFKLDMQFKRSTTPDCSWYVGTISGLNRNRTQLLSGRFALRHDPLDREWLAADKLGTLLLQKEPTLGAYLLEVDQQVPSETLPLYTELGWPHLPRINKEAKELRFDEKLAGQYGCYAVVRLPTNPLRIELEEYAIACYPIRIYEDGRFTIKCAGQIELRGRAFSYVPNRLYLYVDARPDEPQPLHLDAAFHVQSKTPIMLAFGISNRFADPDVKPEARMEALVKLQGTTYHECPYREYDPLNNDDYQLLENQASNLGKSLSGRVNRLIRPNSNLLPNMPIPANTRTEPFRRLHIRAALYEIKYGVVNDKNLLNVKSLLTDAYLHGLGAGEGDVTYLKEQAKNVGDSMERWKAVKDDERDGRDKLIEEFHRLWPTLSDEALFKSV